MERHEASMVIDIANHAATEAMLRMKSVCDTLPEVHLKGSALLVAMAIVKAKNDKLLESGAAIDPIMRDIIAETIKTVEESGHAKV